MVWSDYLPTKSLVGGGGLWSLVLGPYVPDLGPDLDLTWDLDLDLSLTTGIIIGTYIINETRGTLLLGAPPFYLVDSQRELIPLIIS